MGVPRHPRIRTTIGPEFIGGMHIRGQSSYMNRTRTVHRSKPARRRPTINGIQYSSGSSAMEPHTRRPASNVDVRCVP